MSEFVFGHHMEVRIGPLQVTFECVSVALVTYYISLNYLFSYSIGLLLVCTP